MLEAATANETVVLAQTSLLQYLSIPLKMPIEGYLLEQHTGHIIDHKPVSIHALERS
jgi:hypothetical protein